MSKRVTGIFVLTGLVILSLFMSSCGGLKEKEVFNIMDTDTVIKAYGWRAAKAIDLAIDEMKRLDVLLNAFSQDSSLAEINSSAGIKPVKVSKEVYSVIERALDFAKMSDGAFDPTILPMIKLWGFGSPVKRVPSEDEIKETLKLVDYRKVSMDEDESTVFLEEEGMGLDLGAIAKGYAVDRMQSLMRDYGVKSFLVNAGGDVYAGERKPDGSLWKVAVTDPKDPSQYLGVLEVENISLVSSGDYQRYFEAEGVRYHHILDPKTGYPSTFCRGTTVMLQSSEDADALSTAFFVLGPDRSEELLAHFPEASVLFVEKEGNVRSGGIVDKFQFK